MIADNESENGKIRVLLEIDQKIISKLVRSDFYCENESINDNCATFNDVQLTNQPQHLAEQTTC